MALHESGEMYLETILVLHQTKPQVRSIDIADHMHFSKPSVSRAVNLLKNSNYIEIDPSGYITLTETGREIAEKIYERHQVISRMLVSLGVDEETAINDACSIEHVISDASFDALKNHFHLSEKD